MFRAVMKSSHTLGRMRNISLLSVLSLLLVVFGLISKPLTAQAAGEAYWSGQYLVYEQNVYSGPNEVLDGQGLDLPVGSTYYGNVPADTSPNILAVRIISLVGEPLTATSGDYAIYDLNQSSGVFSNKRDAATITIDPATYKPKSSCNIKGIGWLVCPLSESLAEGMDWVYEKLADFFVVQPLQNNQADSLYNFWTVMKNIANITFVLVLALISISYVTNYGLSNYQIKKMVPKIIVASILVNISFYVCQIAIDLSNILGYGVSDLFQAVRIQAGELSTATATYSWGDIVGTILGGVGIGALATVSIGTALGGIAGAIWFIIPLILVSLLVVVVAIITLAGRQAIIVVLVMLSPLAFVANLLPNTEHLFKKWTDLFIKLLIMFPAFSFIFNGAQLAGQVILSSTENFIVIILGLIVQIVPLVLIPALITAGDELLDKIPGVLNGKLGAFKQSSKGYFDSEREISKAKWMAENGTSGGPLNISRNLAKASARTKKLQEKRLQTQRTKFDSNLNNEMSTPGTSAYRVMMEAKKIDIDLSNSTTAIDESWETAKNDIADKYVKAMKKDGTIDLGAVKLSGAKDFDIQLAESAFRQNILNTRLDMAKDSYKSNLNKLIINDMKYDGKTYDNSIRLTSAGVAGDKGVAAILRNVIASQQKEIREASDNVALMLKNYKTDGETTKKLSTDINYTYDLKDEHGNVVHTLKASDEITRRGALQNFVPIATEADVRNILFPSLAQEGPNYDIREYVQELWAKSGKSETHEGLGGRWNDYIIQGYSMADYDKLLVKNTADTITNGKLTTSKVAKQGAVALDDYKSAISEILSDKTNLDETTRRRVRLYATRVDKVLSDPQLSTELNASAEDKLVEIRNMLTAEGFLQQDTAKPNPKPMKSNRRRIKGRPRNPL